MSFHFAALILFGGQADGGRSADRARSVNRRDIALVRVQETLPLLEETDRIADPNSRYYRYRECPA